MSAFKLLTIVVLATVNGAVPVAIVLISVSLVVLPVTSTPVAVVTNFSFPLWYRCTPKPCFASSNDALLLPFKRWK